MKFIFQSFLLLLACGIVFVCDNSISPNAGFLILGSFLAVGFITLFMLRKRADKKTLHSDYSINQTHESFLIFTVITAILVLIFITGKLSSSLFFLLYFVTFGLVFVFEPATVFVFVIGIVFIFLPEIITNSISENVLKAASIILVSPLAFFFGREYVKEQEYEKKNER